MTTRSIFVVFDRVKGTVHPVLEHYIRLEEPATRKPTLEACDREHRFEPIQPWWRFW